MERFTPQSFKGPSAYFTVWDTRIAGGADDLLKRRKSAERKLKVLLLVKSNIVCAASHLNTELVYTIFRDNPILLREKLVIPALRNDRMQLKDVFDASKVNKDVIDYFEDNVQKVVSWELKENTNWYRDKFIAELASNGSVVRTQLSKYVYDRTLSDLIFKISKQDVLERDYIKSIVSELPYTAQQIMLSFSELIYHVSGARVVGCESSLSQENYIDFDLADLTQKRTRLSEENILLKLFFEQAYDAIQKEPLPVELLDILSFADIKSIRAPLMKSEFQAKYDNFIQTAINAIKNHDNGIVINLHELAEIHASIMKTFRDVFDRELRPFAKRRVLDAGGNVMSPAASVALGIVGTMSGIGAFAGLLSLMKDSDTMGSELASFCNILETYKAAESKTKLFDIQEARTNMLRQKIESTEITDKSTMLDMVDLYSNTVSEKIKYN